MGNRIFVIVASLLLAASSFFAGASFLPNGFAKVQSNQSAVQAINPLIDNGKVLSVADVVDRVKPAVVLITVQTTPRDYNWHPVVTDSGTGIIFDPAGFIVTNDHVVASASNNVINVTLLDGRQFTAKTVGRDQAKDLAVIKVDAPNLPSASFGNSDNLRVGDWVIAIGNALDLDGGPSVTMGIVSALDRAIDSRGQGKLCHLIQTDAPINPGNSGGPLVSLDGSIIGVNAAVAEDAQGIGFAIPGNTAISMANGALSRSGDNK